MEEMLAERRALGLARDELSVEASSDRSGRKEDAEFRLQKDGWLLISRFFQNKLWTQALGLVKSMTQRWRAVDARICILDGTDLS